MAQALEIKNLSKHFDGVAALNDVSLSFAAGKITAIVGPNGSGKSTLTNVLTGVYPFDRGSVVVGAGAGAHAGTALKKIHPYDAELYGLTRTFQEVRLFEQMTVLDNVLVALTERGVWGALFECHGKYHLDRASEILKRVGLSEKHTSVAAQLSYGQRKLLEIARALAMRAEIYFFDEVFAGLFPEMVKTVVGIMKELRAGGKTVVMIEHNMELVRELADHLIVLDSGTVLAQGEPAKILARRDVIEAYLGE